MTSPGQHSQHQDPFRAEFVSARDRTAAILRLLPSGAQKSDADRFESYARDNDIPLEWLWTIRNTLGKPSTCLLAVPSPGRTAMLFTSQATNPDQEERLSQLIEHGAKYLEDQSIDLAQALLLTTDRPGLSAFEQSGFRRLAILQYMETTVSRRLEFPVIPDGLELVAFEESMRSQLIQALDASYEDTLDCPALRGLRKTDDVITGHQSTGQFKASLWSIALHHGAPAGAVLINQTKRGQQAELVYIGMAADIRGRGWGRTLLQHAMALASEARLQQLSLAVDLNNTPALDLYTSMGFTATGRRQAVIRSTRSMQED